MKLFFALSLFLCLCCYTLQAQNPTYFNKIYGGSDSINILSTAAKPLGANYYVFGQYVGDNLKECIYMRKIDQLGNTLWLKNLDSTIVGQNYIGIIVCGEQLIISRDQHFIITKPRSNSPGYDEQHITLMKVDTMGQIIWQRTYENPNPAYARSIIQTSDGGYAMVGTMFRPIEGSIYNTALFDFIKTDSEGYLQQEYTYEMGIDAQAFSVQELPDKGYVISGWGVYESVLSDTGFVYIGSDAYVVRIKANGDTLWTHHYGEAGDDFACNVTLLANNEILLSGANKIPGQGIAKLWLARLDTLGNTLWDSTYVQLANTNSYETTIIQKPNGNIVGGAYSYTPTGYPSITQLLEIDPLGNIVYMKALTLPDSMLENNSHVYIKDMQATPDGGYIFAGYKYFQPPQLS